MADPEYYRLLDIDSKKIGVDYTLWMVHNGQRIIVGLTQDQAKEIVNDIIIAMTQKAQNDYDLPRRTPKSY